jgi:hypothetical protein
MTNYNRLNNLFPTDQDIIDVKNSKQIKYIQKQLKILWRSRELLRRNMPALISRKTDETLCTLS